MGLFYSSSSFKMEDTKGNPFFDKTDGEIDFNFRYQVFWDWGLTSAYTDWIKYVFAEMAHRNHV